MGGEPDNKMNFADCEYTALMYLAANTYQFKVGSGSDDWTPVNMGGTANPKAGCTQYS